MTKKFKKAVNFKHTIPKVLAYPTFYKTQVNMAAYKSFSIAIISKKLKFDVCRLEKESIEDIK